MPKMLNLLCLLVAACAQFFTPTLGAEKQANQIDSCAQCSIFVNSSQWHRLNSTLEQIIWQIQGISALSLRLHGVQVNKSLLESSEIYDPSWWVWGRSGNDVFFSMPPLTMDVLSLHTLTLTTRNLDIYLQSSPSGCMLNLSIECLTSRLAVTLVDLLSPIRAEVFRDQKGGLRGDVLCESSFTGVRDVTLGWRCLRLTREHLQLLGNLSSSETYWLMMNTSATDLAMLAMIMAFLLPMIPVLRCLVQSFGCKEACRSELIKNVELQRALSDLAEQCERDEQTKAAVQSVLESFSTHLASTQTELEQVLRSMSDEVNEMHSKMRHALYRLAKREYQPSGQCTLRDWENCEYFELRNNDNTACKHWLVADKSALLDHESPAPYLRLLQQSLLNERAVWGGVAYVVSCILELLIRVAPFLGLHVCIIYWLCSYSEVSERFANLDSDARVFLNLANAPFALFFTNNSTAQTIAWTAMGLHILFVLSVFLPSMVRFAMPLCIKRRGSRVFFRRAKELHLDYPVRMVLSLLMVLEYVNLFIMISSLSTTFLYLLVGLIVNIKATAPFLTGLVTFGYYLGTYSHGVAGNYSQLKRLLFKFAMDSKNIKWKGVKREKKPDGNLRTVSLQGVVLFDSETWSHSLVFPQLLEISLEFFPLTVRLWSASLRLVMEMQFIVLIVFVMLSFRSSLYQDSLSIVITTIVSLLSSLIPKFAEMLTGAETKKLKEAALESRVADYLNDANRQCKYDVLVTSDCTCSAFQLVELANSNAEAENSDQRLRLHDTKQVDLNEQVPLVAQASQPGDPTMDERNNASAFVKLA